MSAIKDAVDLITQLSESVNDRKFANDLFKIIQLINTIQSDQVNITESNMQLLSEKANLQNTITALESNIARLQQQISELETPSKNNEADTSDLAKQILLYSSESSEGVSIGMVQHKFNISSAKSEHQLGKLKEAELIDYGSLNFGPDIRYSPTQEGLNLLDENDLI